MGPGVVGGEGDGLAEGVEGVGILGVEIESRDAEEELHEGGARGLAAGA